ncbi:beta-galactosidase trimerization domain-containing protein [Cyclobacterium sp. SYSU L10401]|uniref:beta-galactosidase trimerization domain-containing protein n=1 Tax=Cyclobacterium sp. SYSU L10401 TaxID=2678657 RepID=UPI001F09F2FC|nr:beta-galactosidase trimerization domain-containing protein [Cyclobacterium sp. SYSU L10401]
MMIQLQNLKLPLTRIFLLIALYLSGIACAFSQETHDFLHELYDQRNESPMQQKFREIAPVPAGVVYIQRPGEGEKEIRAHFRKMKALGFTNLKQIMTLPDWNHEEIQLIALEEGLIPWWYGEGGWEAITPELLEKLKIDKNLSLEDIRHHPEMIAHQTEVFRERIKKYAAHYQKSGSREAFRGSSSAYDPIVGQRGLDLSEKGKALFVRWARETYQNIAELNHAYNQHHHGLAAGGKAFDSWEDFEKRWESYNHRELRIIRDIFRFKADYGVQNLSERVREFRSIDPNAPYRAGGELGLFRPHAYFGVNFPGIASEMKHSGSFYPSIHFTWHFDQVRDELGPMVYVQASYINDMFKGGWSGGWETTGGPQQFGGEKFGQNNKGFTVDAPEMEQFTLSMLAAGFKGWGLWSWSVRSAGAEVGEYALLDHHNEITDRAIAVGKIARAMQQFRGEIWSLHKEPQVGIFFDWDNEAIWTALSVKGQDSLRYRPMEARVGLSRALINKDIPFEFVTPEDIRAGLAARYPIIYMPAILAMNRDLFPLMEKYVQEGGKLVLDMPGAWMDTYSALFPRGTDSAFARLFGAVLREYQYSGINRNWKLNGHELTGSIADLRVEGAAVWAAFDNGKPAVTLMQKGKGKAVIVGFEASRACFRRGNVQEENRLVELLMELGAKSPISSEQAIVYRLAGPKVDHCFLMNEADRELSLPLKINGLHYSSMEDAVTGEVLDLNQPVSLDANGARWLRLIK